MTLTNFMTSYSLRRREVGWGGAETGILHRSAMFYFLHQTETEFN